MCDTNWCTFCDCAVSPYSESVYCSEECFQQDASFADDSLFRTSVPSLPPRKHSISGEDLALMYSDSIHSSISDRNSQQSVVFPPMLSLSISSPSIHNDLALRTPIHVSNDSPICEKLDLSTNNTPSFIFNGVPQQTRV